MDADTQRIIIAIRIRPQLEAEKFDVTAVRKVETNTAMVISDELNTSASAQSFAGFKFDAVFDDGDDQRTVYEEGCVGIIDAALDGRFVTILAYGQTGSGKTYTVLGAPANANGGLQSQTGLFLRVFNDLFQYKQSMQARLQVLIVLSAVELYLDDFFDLLSERAKLKLRETSVEATLQGAKYVEVKSLNDVIRYFVLANNIRSVTATKMNAESSRSHALFFIDLFQAPGATPLALSDVLSPEGDIKTAANIVHSRISLVDLAGSERIKKSGVEGQALTEANTINKSLSTLGTVINALCTNGKGHIPFRENRLTSILKPAFMDTKSRLLLIGHVSPAGSNCAESLMTLKFCDRLKSLKANSVTLSEDPQMLQSAAVSSKTAAELAADAQISMVRGMYTVSRPRLTAKVKRITFDEAFAVSVARAKEQSVAAQRQMADEEAMMQHRFAQLTKQHIGAMLANRTPLEGRITELEKQLIPERQATEALLAKYAEIIESKMTLAKKAKKTRVHTEERLKALTHELKDLDETLEKLSLSALQIERSGAVSSSSSEKHLSADDAEWRREEALWAQLEGNHGIIEDFYRFWRPLGRTHGEYLATLSAKLFAVRDELAARARLAAAKAGETLGNLIPDVVHFMVDRAVDISLGVLAADDRFEWFDVYGSSTRLKDWHFWPAPLVTTPDARFPPPTGPTTTPETTMLSEDEEPPMMVTPQRETTGNTTPVDAPPPLEITHAEAVRAAREKRKQIKAGANSVSKRLETEEANKHYLMTVYDSPTLVQDVSRFLGAGTMMEKHGRSGAPHRKKVFIAINNNQREVVWVDPPESKHGGTRSSIPVNSISKIVLGSYSKVFKRHPCTPNDATFYLSFSLHTKDKSRTLDLVADSLVDFEAWVLGLSHMVQVDPVWGGSLPVTKEAIAAFDLSPKEVTLCEKENILPQTYAAIKKKVVGHRDDVAHQMAIFNNDPVQAYQSMGGIHAPQMNHKGAVLMTKGELRYHTKNWSIDIFRVCKLWSVFRELDIIYDPSYLPATCFGTNVRA